jgi:hypothetical protein
MLPSFVFFHKEAVPQLPHLGHLLLGSAQVIICNLEPCLGDDQYSNERNNQIFPALQLCTGDIEHTQVCSTCQENQKQCKSVTSLPKVVHVMVEN